MEKEKEKETERSGCEPKMPSFDNDVGLVGQCDSLFMTYPSDDFAYLTYRIQ